MTVAKLIGLTGIVLFENLRSRFRDGLLPLSDVIARKYLHLRTHKTVARTMIWLIIGALAVHGACVERMEHGDWAFGNQRKVNCIRSDVGFAKAIWTKRVMARAHALSA